MDYYLSFNLFKSIVIYTDSIYKALEEIIV